MSKVQDSSESMDLSFEQAFERLSQVVSRLEAGEGTLTERTQLFQEGMGLSRLCSERLDSIEKKVEILLQNQDGQLAVESFEEEPAG